MKKVLSIVLALAVMLTAVVSCFAFTASATDNLSAVGALSSSMWKEFSVGEMNKVSQLIRAEFNRTSQLRSEMHKGTQYFNYGESTDELVHSWAGTAGEYNGVPHDAVGCMNQDFAGGTSTCLEAFGQPPQWCCILVTRASFEKNEAYTVRDSIASQYASAGGTNSAWGMPTSNQYWVVEDGKEVLYQQFDNGYARAVDGSALSAFFGFHYKWDEETDMNYPKSGEPDRPSFANVEIKSTNGPELLNPNDPVVVPPDMGYSEPDENIDDNNNTDNNNNNNTDKTGDTENPGDATNSDGTTVSGDATASGDAAIVDGDDIAENGDGTAATTSGNVRVIRHNSPFYQFVLDYWWVLVIAGVVLIAIIVIVIVVVVNGKKKKAAAGADNADNAPAEEPAEDSADDSSDK